MTTRIRLFGAVVGRRGTLTAADRRLIRDIMPRTVARRHLWPKNSGGKSLHPALLMI